MKYKKCEHCGEDIHIRSQKCPFCNQTVAEVSPEDVEEIEETEEKVDTAQEKQLWEDDISERNDEIEEKAPDITSQPQIHFEVGSNGEPKDYVYRAEVKHSLEYTNPLSNMAKVFISALCTLPIIGQLVGIFIGVFFSTYEDSDRRSFGRALIFLSVFMFVIWFAYIKYAMNLLQKIDVNSLYNSLGQ